jgi:F0F1-type ATP synthase membrane subunit c/vacuolar-type H+-ATPase subunit K
MDAPVVVEKIGAEAVATGARGDGIRLGLAGLVIGVQQSRISQKAVNIFAWFDEV